MSNAHKTLAAVALSTMALSCAEDGSSNRPDPTPAPKGKTPATELDEDGEKKPLPPISAEAAPDPSTRLAIGDDQPRLDAIVSHFEGLNEGRIYIQVDKPLYKPGETVWFRGWAVNDKNLQPRATGWHSYELISPKGASVLRKRVKANEGPPANDFEIPAGVQGGEYQIRVRTSDGLSGERPIVVAAYEAPRIKKKLEFMRKAYGAGDTVQATLEMKRPTGAPLANHPLRPVGTLDGRPLEIPNVKTDAKGEATVTFTLPERIESADGLLTVMVEDGGITESISKRIPIVLKRIQMGFYPEGGKLVEGIESRLYFDAKNSIGKPADVSGKIVDDLGNAVAEFTTYHKGVGRVPFTPASGRRYHAEVTQPAGIGEKYALPIPESEGCVLRTYDDLDGELPELRVKVTCSEEKEVWVVGTLRDELFDTAKVKTGPEGAVVYLKPKEGQEERRGIARVTVFAEGSVPLAERLVFRKRRAGLDIELEVDESRYAPRDQVELSLTTKAPNGEPVEAEVAVSIVDDTVISFADDKTGHLTSRLLFETEIPGKVEEPKFFLDLTEEKSAMALELLMGTRGYRQFNWRPVLEPRPMVQESFGGRGLGAAGGGMADGLAVERIGARKGAARRRPAAVPPPAPAVPMGMEEPAPDAEPAELGKLDAMANQAQPLAQALAAEAEAPGDQMMDVEADDMPMEGEIAAEPPARREMGADKDWARAQLFEKKRELAPQYAPVREFPLPSYTGEFTGVRSDFRETIYWSPRIKTDAKGQAKVRFFLSDAVTSFRIFAEGAGGDALGRKEKTFESSLPFSLNVKLPLEVSAGDEPRIPLTLSNERDEKAQVSLSASFGDLLKLNDNVALPGDGLGAKERASLFYPLTVTGTRGASEVRISASSAGLQDEIVRPMKVVPKGFPRIVATSGTVRESSEAIVDLTGAIEGTAKAQVTVYPSITATLVSGLEGILREPYGCFEQTSSSNYPNVLVMDYLQSSGQGDPAVLARAGELLDKGYKRLVSFETQEKGYEWFGSTPAHEALTAYGVLEFADMKRVYGGVDDAMLARTVKYLEQRRDGQGGFERDSKALDSFGRADPEITNAYITYAVTEAGYGDRFAKEVGALASAAKNSQDPYILALAANTLLTLPKMQKEGQAALKKLIALQEPDGSFDGSTHSITRSTGKNLSVETTGLAVLAMLKSEGNLPRAQKAVSWLTQQRQYGAFGATQATVMALRAITAFGQAAQKASTSGAVTLLVNGQVVATQRYEAGQSEALVFDGFESGLKLGENQISVRHEGKGEIPYEVGVEYYVERGQDHPEAGLSLETSIAKEKLAMGETVRMTAVLENTLQEGRPMTLARVGLPGGLTFQTWQLKELREKGLIAFYETQAREVILYFRQMKPGEKVEIPLELMATVPGRYTSPASRAYLYYTDDKKVWAEPIEVTITP